MADQLRLFLDASTLIAAAASPDGGSSLVVELCTLGKAKALVTRLVLREAERNINNKLSEQVLLRYYNFLGSLDPELVPPPSLIAIQRAAELVADKDARVLAAAREGDATYLITLDRKHLLPNEVRQGALPIIVCTPGDYLQELLKDRD
jgi:predicted nucleic acid-binding protein